MTGARSPRSPLHRELEAAREAAVAASQRILEIYDTEFRVSYKDALGDDPVTQADREANAVIVDRLRRAFPGDAIVAEESPLPVGFERVRRCWFVDPIDGTKEFVARNGEFSPMIGLAIDGRAVLGVIALPALGGAILLGEVGVGAWAVEPGGVERALHVTDLSEPSRARVMVSRSRRAPALDAVFRALGAPTEIPCGSVGVKVARLALGDADAYVNLGSGSGHGMKLWDVCAPEALLVAAGGTFTDQLGRAIDYRNPDVGVRDGVVASNGRLHAALLDAIGAGGLPPSSTLPARGG